MGSTNLEKKLRKNDADKKKRKLGLKPKNLNPKCSAPTSEERMKKKKKEKHGKGRAPAIPNGPALSNSFPADPASDDDEERRKKKQKKRKKHQLSNPYPAEPPVSEEERRKKKSKKHHKGHPAEIPNDHAFSNPSPADPTVSSDEERRKKKKKKKHHKDHTSNTSPSDPSFFSDEERRRKKQKEKKEKKKHKDHPEIPNDPALSNPSPAEPPSSSDGDRVQMLLEPRNPNPRCSAPTSEERSKKKKKKPDKDHSEIPHPQSNGPTEPLSSSNDGRVGKLLEPYSKDQLIDFLCDAALADPALAARIRATADHDVSHRKVFVRGLPWDATRENLLEVFSPFGPVDDCNVVNDKVTGRCKGYGFVLFRSRSGTIEALRQPEKVIKNHVARCHLASERPVAQLSGCRTDTTSRRIFVSNVHQDASPEKLKALFAKFGEIEKGPTGFDTLTGKSRGYATFVYKTQDGARKALMEPYKMFEGHQLHCQWHVQPANAKEPVPMGTPAAVASPASRLVGAAPQSVLAAVAAVQNLSMYSHDPAYAALFGQNPFLAQVAGINPAAALNTPALGGGLAGYGGNSSSLGSQGTTRLQEMQFGQSSLSRPGGFQGGMSAYIWYVRDPVETGPAKQESAGSSSELGSEPEPAPTGSGISSGSLILVWQDKNKWMFEGQSDDTTCIVRAILNLAACYLLAAANQNWYQVDSKEDQQKCNQWGFQVEVREPGDKSNKWSSPPLGWLKLNFDGATDQESGKSGAGFLIRNWSGGLVWAEGLFLGMASVLKAEAMALLKGVMKLRELISNDIEGAWVEGDSLYVVQFLDDVSRAPTEIREILKKAKEVIDGFPRVRVSHIKRDGNKAADWLAVEARKAEFSISWSLSIPAELEEICNWDNSCPMAVKG